MKIYDEINPFLKGEKFTNALKVPISEPEKKISLRMDYIENIIKGKNVIHLGCADHIPLIINKIKKNTWFHKRLTEVSKECLGIDIDLDAVEYIKTELGYQNVIYADIVNDEPLKEIVSHKWDYIVIGELLEHLDSPITFLSSIQKKYSKVIDHLIASAPNALRMDNYRNAKKHQELINSDHRFWFTPYTLAKILTLSGFKIESFQFCEGFKVGQHLLYKKRLLKKYPAFRDTLVMLANF